jgi:hypothetical protein
MKLKRTCVLCGEPYRTGQPNAKYCSDPCKRRAKRERQSGREPLCGMEDRVSARGRKSILEDNPEAELGDSPPPGPPYPWETREEIAEEHPTGRGISTERMRV